MSQEATGYISNIKAIPEVAERFQYGKYACVLSAPKGAVTFTIFNATALDDPEGLFEPGPPERKTIKIRKGQAVDYDLLAKLLQQGASAV
jgi:hypothetical protein